MAYFTTLVASESGGGGRRNSGNGESKANVVAEALCMRCCQRGEEGGRCGWHLGLGGADKMAALMLALSTYRSRNLKEVQRCNLAPLFLQVGIKKQKSPTKP